MLLRSGFFHPLFQQIGNGVTASRCGFFYFVRVDAKRDIGIGMSHNTGDRRNIGSLMYQIGDQRVSEVMQPLERKIFTLTEVFQPCVTILFKISGDSA